MGVQYTADQQKAIDTRGSNLLVSAAAGSGKTAVLVQRIIKIITNDSEPVDIDRLLVVTFTEAAASEMRQRIQEAISQKLEEDPLNEHLRRQSVLIHKAPISTIHAFCNSVIRQNFFAVGLDPSYKVADTTESAILQEEALEVLFTAEYLKEDNGLFYDLIEIYSDRFSDEKLRDLVIGIYNFASNSPDPDKWLLENSSKFLLEEDFSLEDTLWGEFLINSVKVRLEGVRTACLNAIKICSFENGPQKYAECLNEELALTEALIASCAGSFDHLYEAFNQLQFSKIPAIRASDNVSEELKELVKEIRDKQIKYALNNIKSRVFFKPPQMLKEDLKNLYPYMNKLSQLVIEFRNIYKGKKTEHNLLDFNDLEHICLEILDAKGGEIADIYKEKFYEVFIDEYQDSNLVQETILSKVSKENNRFMVGDIKQSIYKFRRAKPEIFIEKYRTYQYEGRNIKIDLSKNFRSRTGIINTVNYFFRQLMSVHLGDVAYSHTEELYYGADYPEEENNAYLDTEINIIDNSGQEDDLLDETITDYSNAELESKFIAKRIDDMLKDGDTYRVYDRKTGESRSCRCSDIVILLRSVKNADIIITELGKYNIPAYSDTSTDYFKNVEILTLYSLLKIIDNPLQDIELLGVLHSVIYNFTADELVKIRSYDRNKYFYECMSQAEKDAQCSPILSEKINRFKVHLLKWRKMASFIKVTDLIDIILQDTEYTRYLASRKDYLVRQGNLRTFKELASNYEKGSMRGLYNFIRYLDKMSIKNNQISNAKVISENDNTVKIMSIHKSKGLEYPYVFVSMLGSKFNKLDERQDIILHQDFGFGPRYTDLSLRVKKDTAAHLSLAEKTREENYSEEIRILYVALTRAKEKLILTGCTKDARKSIQKWAQVLIGAQQKLPSGYMLSCERYIDWIMPAVLRHKSSAELLKLSGISEFLAEDEFYDAQVPLCVQLIDAADIYAYEDQMDKPKDELEPAAAITEAELNEAVYNQIHKKLSWRYPDEESTKMPLKVLISEVKRNFIGQSKLDAQADEVYKIQTTFEDPDFLKEDRPLTAAEKGTAIHTVMEHLDVNLHNTQESIQQLISELQSKNILSEKEAENVNMNKLLAFVRSDLAKRIALSPKVYRETSFVMEIPAKEAFVQTEDENAKVLINGIIDCFFLENDGCVLVDYKTDFVRKEDIESFKNKYLIQLSIYKRAIEHSFNMQVKECILYLFYLDDYITVKI